MSAPPAAASIAELRRSFDAAFARPADERPTDVEELLVLRVAGDPFAVRAREVSGLAGRRRIVPVPGPVPELLGITTIRGAVLPVYGLGALLGYPAAGETPTWLLWCGGDEAPAALGFDRFERYTRVPRSELSAGEDGAGRRHVRELVRLEGGVCGIIGIRSVLEEITRRIGSPGRGKE